MELFIGGLVGLAVLLVAFFGTGYGIASKIGGLEKDLATLKLEHLRAKLEAELAQARHVAESRRKAHASAAERAAALAADDASERLERLLLLFPGAGDADRAPAPDPGAGDAGAPAGPGGEGGLDRGPDADPRAAV